MKTSVLLLMYWHAGFLLSQGASLSGDVKEYCERESFEAACGGSEVILMRSAKYGRLRMGRCVKNNYGSIGCASDVMPTIDMMCSGRHDCKFTISEIHAHSTNPCPNELLAYLEASYECIKVATCKPNTCNDGSFLKMTSPSGYIASTITAETGCGSRACPWVLDPKPGQRFNLTFYNFLQPSETQLKAKYCNRFASVVNRKTQVAKDITVCGKEPRQVTQLTAVSAQIEIRMYGTLTGDDGDKSQTGFLMKYEVVGCPDIEPIHGAAVKRDGDILSVTCNSSRRAWHLTCSGTAWVGEVGTCDDRGTSQAWTLGAALQDAGSTPQGLLMVVAIGVAMGIILGFTMLAVTIVCMKRRRAHQYGGRHELITQSCESDKTYSSKMYDTGSARSPSSANEAAYNRTYQSQASVGGLAPKTLPVPVAQQQRALPVPEATAVQPYFTGSGVSASDGTIRGNRDHVYESPNFVQEMLAAAERQNQNSFNRVPVSSSATS